MIKRNILLRKVNRRQTITELLLPLFFCFMGLTTINESTKVKYEKVGPTTLENLKSIELSYDNIYQKNSTIGFILPKNGQDESIINKVMSYNEFYKNEIKGIHFKDQKEMDEYTKDFNNHLIAGIIFESEDFLHYTIRVNGTSVPDSNLNPQINYALGRDQYEKKILPSDTYMQIFTPVQAAVDQAIIRLKTNDDSFNLVHYVGRLGKPAVEYASSDANNNNILAYDVGAMYIVSIILICTNLVKEKEDKLKEGLLMAGVHPTVFWLSWLIVYIIITFIISIIVTFVFTIVKAFGNLNPIISFIAFFLYGLSCSNLAFFFSTFFNKTKTSGTVVSIILLVLVFSNFATSYIDITKRKIISFIFSPLSMGSFVNEVYSLRANNEEITFNNIFKTNAGIFLLGLLVTNIIYFVVAVISDGISFGENNYLFKRNIKINDYHDAINNVNYEKDIQEDFNAKRNEKCRVEVSHVHKVFKRKYDKNDQEIQEKSIKNDEFLAVDDVSFKVYQNEIFALLGHNGAGKTTLINIMVGIVRASYGNVFFDGRSISSSKNEIRKDFGVCAQTNIIYDELTVEDHINFYASLKNINVDVDEVLKDLDLIQQKELKASKLSGGQKRKLCIGMAIVGNPKYIFLDEPTTGLDPLSRRKIWGLLLKKKEGRVIFLTTHYMDEADILADRKLILNKGKIRCLGTSLFLKNHFNMSYNLDIETNNPKDIGKLVKNYIPEATYYENSEEKIVDNSNSNKYHTWKLPLNSTFNFSDLLNELDQQKNNNYIHKYALTMPTLEELFIRLEDDNLNTEDDEPNYNEKQHLIQTETELPELKTVNKPNRLAHLMCLTKYRFKIFLKDKAFAINSILTPVIIAAVTFFIFNLLISQSSVSPKSTVISIPTLYSDTLINYDTNSSFIIPQENMISTIGNRDNLKSMALNEIPFPKSNEKYYLASITGRKSENSNIFEVYYNDTMIHGLPAIFNAISNAILSSKNVKGQIITNSHPFENKNNVMAILGLLIAGMMIGMSFTSSLSKFGPLITHERINQLLQQLQLNGVSRINYWISNFITDYIIFITTCILIIIAGIIIKFDPLMDITVILVILVTLFIWSVPTIIYQFILSFFFNKEESAISYINIINSYTVIFGYLIFIFIDTVGENKVEVLMTNNGIYSIASVIYNVIITAVSPSYGIIAILNALFNIKIFGKLLNYELTLNNLINVRNGISPILITLIVMSIVYFFMLINLDRNKNQTNKRDINELDQSTKEIYEEILRNGDDDVNNEFEYIKANQKDLPISVLHLSKEFVVTDTIDKEKKEKYSKVSRQNFTFGQIHRSMFNDKFVKTAVVDVNFGVRNHECFGLLGPNGAGKSTTLNTITSTIPQTTGTICFNGVETHLARLGDISLGYCPQKDILWKELTLREHIEFFLSIRGYTTEESKEYASQYISIAGLEEHQNKRVENLSGGTKRKLSLLIAICGYPKQILLDEPTAGMDPSTRRLIWNIINKSKNMNESALILTTHSMEEAENLCDRLAILVNGRLNCIGSPEHLKMKYGDSYVLELQSEDMDKFHHDYIESRNLFNGKEYTMERSSDNRAKYEVKLTDNFGSIFEIMEQCKRKGLVQDYSFSQTSLEQVFINFAKKQIIEPEY